MDSAGFYKALKSFYEVVVEPIEISVTGLKQCKQLSKRVLSNSSTRAKMRNGRASQTPEHQVGTGEIDKGFTGFGSFFVVFG